MERIKFADVHQAKVGFDETDDVGAVTDREVEVDDGETLREAVHKREQTRRETVDA